MKRNKVIEASSHDKLEHKQRAAFHEAGHAAGIHLNNKARHLPPVFFKIIFKGMDGIEDLDSKAYSAFPVKCIAGVEGGRLIETLPPPIDSCAYDITQHHDVMVQLVNDYNLAFEADVTNLLIGPLAEAKHVAETDGELFNHKLVNLSALDNYGGSSDLALVNEYLESYSADNRQKDEKLAELFTVAFNFINNGANWAAITKLAEYILGSNKNTIDCEEIFSTLDQSVDHFQKRRSMTGLYPDNCS